MVETISEDNFAIRGVGDVVTDLRGRLYSWLVLSYSDNYVESLLKRTHYTNVAEMRLRPQETYNK